MHMKNNAHTMIFGELGKSKLRCIVTTNGFDGSMILSMNQFNESRKDLRNFTFIFQHVNSCYTSAIIYNSNEVYKTIYRLNRKRTPNI